MIKAIVFDFDGVIVESIDIKTRAFAKLFETEGNDIVEKVVDYHVKNSGVSRFEKFRYIYKEILKRHLSGDEFQGLCSHFSQLVADAVAAAPFVSGAREFLENYFKVYDFYIASATPQDEIENIIKRRQMQRYFKRVYGSPKKKVDIVREILAAYILEHNEMSSDLVFSPQSFVYVGDTMSDYLAAKENKVAFIARVTDDNYSLFDDLDCTKIKNLINLKNAVSSICCQTEKNLG